MNLRKPIFLKRCFLLLSGMILLTACGRDDSASLSEQLDYMIRNKRLFDEKKEERIDIFRRMLHVTSLTPEQEYALNDSLSEVFYKYRLDSAIRYGERNLELARRIGDRNRSASAAIRLARFYSSRGACIEARQLLDSVRRELPRSFLEPYYQTYIFFYDCYEVFSGSSRPANNRKIYRDSLRRHLGIPASNSETREQTEQRLLERLGQIPPGTPEYAKTTNSLGDHYRAHGDDWLAKKYYTLSAIADIQNATKENSAILSLAKLYFDHKDYSRAYKYTQSAIEDALCSNMQFRIVRMTELSSIIIASHQDKEAKTKVKLQHYLILISVLSVGKRVFRIIERRLFD